MRINGKVFTGPYIKTVVLPRGEDCMAFRLQAVTDHKMFDELCPRPTPAVIVKRGGEKVMDVDAPEFREALDVWAMKRTHWLFLQSLAATEGLEWDTVKMGDPDTWPNYQDELKEAGLTDSEIAILVEAMIEVNGMDQAKIKEATESFLAEAAKQALEN